MSLLKLENIRMNYVIPLSKFPTARSGPRPTLARPKRRPGECWFYLDSTEP